MINQKYDHSCQPQCPRHLPPRYIRQNRRNRISSRDGGRNRCPVPYPDNRYCRAVRHIHPDKGIAEFRPEGNDKPDNNDKPRIIAGFHRIMLRQKRCCRHIKKCGRRHSNGAYQQHNHKAFHFNPSAFLPIGAIRQCPYPSMPYPHKACSPDRGKNCRDTAS